MNCKTKFIYYTIFYAILFTNTCFAQDITAAPVEAPTLTQKTPFVQIMFTPFLGIGSGTLPTLRFTDINSNNLKYSNNGGLIYQAGIKGLFKLYDFGSNFSLAGGPNILFQATTQDYLEYQEIAGIFQFFYDLCTLFMYNQNFKNYTIIGAKSNMHSILIGPELGIRKEGIFNESSIVGKVDLYATYQFLYSIPGTNYFGTGPDKVNHSKYSFVTPKVSDNSIGGINLTFVKKKPNSSINYGLNFYINSGDMSWDDVVYTSNDTGTLKVPGSSTQYNNVGFEFIFGASL